MLAIIVAIDENNLIGNGNELPWYYPEDLRYFKKVTNFKSVLMGYNTYLSIIERNGKTLPNRTSYVLTEEETLPHGGIIVTNLEELIEAYRDDELFVIGGRMVYEQMLPLVDRLYITRIPGKHDGDVFFPTIDYSEFKMLGSSKGKEVVFEVYERIKKWYSHCHYYL